MYVRLYTYNQIKDCSQVGFCLSVKEEVDIGDFGAREN